MLRREWVARCDEPGCSALEFIETNPESIGRPKDDAGMALNDRGWQASPGESRIYCPQHRDDLGKCAECGHPEAAHHYYIACVGSLQQPRCGCLKTPVDVRESAQ